MVDKELVYAIFYLCILIAFFDNKKMQFDSVNKPGILLEVVQILTDLDFIITKAYISSDGGWFMDGMFEISWTFIPNELTTTISLKKCVPVSVSDTYINGYDYV